MSDNNFKQRQVLFQTWTQRSGNICKISASLRRQCFVKSPVNRFLASKNIPVAPQPPYSPDLSPCDFFLFPKLKNHLKGHHFGTLENIQTAVTDQLKAIPICEFHQCYEEWKKRVQRLQKYKMSFFYNHLLQIIPTSRSGRMISHELVVGIASDVLWFCVLVPLKTRHVEVLRHVKSDKAQNPHIDVERKFE
ncbi:putative transposase [Trichonephila clavipes]|nr:putative transposase [Trichonephila clavipes]